METYLTDADITLEHSTTVEKNIQESLMESYQNQDTIELRLVKLDEEWDLEKVKMMMASALTFPALLLGAKHSRKWLMVPAIASASLLSHALTNWCPSTPLLKALGFRSRVEIEKEKYALKAMRGDFKDLLDVPNSVWNAVNK